MEKQAFVGNATLVVTSTLAVVTALLYSPLLADIGHVALQPWRESALLFTCTVALIGVLRAEALEWRSKRGQTRRADRRAKMLVAARAAARDRETSAEAPLSPLRVFFTLRHTTLSDIIAIAFAPGDGDPGTGRRRVRGSAAAVPPLAAVYNTIPTDARDPSSTMSQEALAGWLERNPDFCEWPIKRLVDMTVEIQAAGARAGDSHSGLVRFQRRFVGHGAEVTNVHRCGDLLFQDNDIPDWQVLIGAGRTWKIADLEDATLHIATSYLSFSDINFRRPPKFHNLHLYFGDEEPHVLFFTEEQLASPAIVVDSTPLLHGAFFKTLILKYTLTLTRDLLSTQLLPVALAARAPAPAARAGAISGGRPSHAASASGE